MAISQTGSRNLWAALTRTIASAWFGRSTSGVERPPDTLSNEYLISVNAAGTGYVNLIKADGSDVVTLGGPVATPSGQSSVAGSPLWMWVASYTPATNAAGTSSTPTANQQLVGPVWLETNCTITGACYLVGTVGGTDRVIAALYNNAGVLVANSSVTSSGTLVGTASTIQKLDFTSPYSAIGPANYWLSIQASGTTARLATIPVGIAFTATSTNATATPAASITAPTGFNANAAAIMAIY